MTKTLLVHLPYPVIKDTITVEAGIPIRTAYLSAILNKNDIKHDIVDLNILSIKRFGIKRHNELIRLIYKTSTLGYVLKSKHNKKQKGYLRWIYSQIDAKRYDFLCLNVDNPFSMNIIESSRRINDNIKIVVGGRNASLSPENFIGKVDFVCLGFAEESLPEILKGEPKRGIAYHKKNSMIIKPPTEKISKVLTPDYKKIDLKGYFKYFNYVPLISSMGCNFGCTYCAFSAKTRYRKREFDELLDEIEFFKREYGIKNFTFYDNSINPSTEHIKELNQIIVHTNIKWKAMFRTAPISTDLIKDIKKSGCIFAFFGLETPVKRLQLLIKKIQPEGSMRTIQQFNKIGIKTRIGFMYDLPTESFSDFISCLKIMLKKRLFDVKFNKLRIIQNTEMYNDISNLIPIIWKRGGFERIRSRQEIVSLIFKTMIAETINKVYRAINNNLDNSFYYRTKMLRR